MEMNSKPPINLAELVTSENRHILATVLMEWNEHVYLTGLTSLSEEATELIPATCDTNISQRDFKHYIKSLTTKEPQL